MKVILCAVTDDLRAAYATVKGPDVEQFHGNILTLTVDAVVSPANSFGFMDGGIDLWYTYHFGDIVQRRLQQFIKEDWGGELPVGQADVVETDNALIPYVISAPTMRTPMILPADTRNPYLAAKAAISCALQCGMESIAIPGLGTGVGRVPAEVCAAQVQEAITELLG